MRKGARAARRPSASTVGLALLLAAAAACAGASEHGPRVVASVKPLHSLVAGVMQGIGKPALIVDGAQSPHTFALRPSQARLLARAQLVFWMGPALEVAIARAVRANGGDAVIIALLEMESIRQAGHADTARDAHEHASPEPHLWLNPMYARAMVDVIASTLGQVDPENQSRYGANARSLAQRLDTLDAELALILAPLAAKPYVVFHDAYGALEHRYGLERSTAIRLNPHAPPGAARVSSVRRLLASSDASCVFTEPQFEPGLVRSLVADTGAGTAVIDPLGASLEPGPALYFELMHDIAATLAECLSAGE